MEASKGTEVERIPKPVSHLGLTLSGPSVTAHESRQRGRFVFRPQLAFVPLPLLLTGEQPTTTTEPVASLYGQIPAVIEREGVMDASILVGYAWADEPRSGASVVALGTVRADCTWQCG